MNKTALIIGATGLTGQHCLQEIVASPQYKSVLVLTRKALKFTSEKVKNLVVDFDNLSNIRNQIKADDVYCCIGTTIKKAGSETAFRKVDLEIPMMIADVALQNGAKQFILVSAIGADPASSIFYNKVKGELEDALQNLNYQTLLIFRPSVLLGKREETRLGEKVAIFVAEKLDAFFIGPLAKYRGTPVAVLAKLMVNKAQQVQPRVRIIENNEILDYLKSKN